MIEATSCEQQSILVDYDDKKYTYGALTWDLYCSKHNGSSVHQKIALPTVHIRT